LLQRYFSFENEQKLPPNYCLSIGRSPRTTSGEPRSKERTHCKLVKQIFRPEDAGVVYQSITAIKQTLEPHAYQQIPSQRLRIQLKPGFVFPPDHQPINIPPKQILNSGEIV